MVGSVHAGSISSAFAARKSDSAVLLGDGVPPLIVVGIFFPIGAGLKQAGFQNAPSAIGVLTKHAREF